MADGKTVSVAGHKISRTEAAVFGVAAIGVIIYAVIEKRKSAAAAAAASTGTAAGQFTDPAGNTCAAPNPDTGFCPGTPEDISAQEQLAAGGSDYGLAGGGGEDTTGTLASDGGILNYGSSVPTFTDNGSWGEYVEQQLGSNGSDAIAAAIAKYLNGQSLTSAQVTTVEEAVAIANYPPVNGAGGYPPSMNVSAGNNSTTIAVPNVTGMSVAAATAALTAAGLKADASKTTGTVASQAPAAGTMAAQGATVTLTIGAAGKTAATITVPSVTGQHAAAAVAVLKQAGLAPHLNRQTPRGKVGTIDSQTPAAGTKAAKGARVDLDNKIS